MARRKPKIRIRTYGTYTQWDSESRELPRLLEITTRIPAVIDVEFGLIVNVKGGRNQQLHYCIDHPGIADAGGNTRPPFEGTVYVRTNDWNFYLGDTIWEPIDDKLGSWHLSLKLDDFVVAAKTFDLYRPDHPDPPAL